MKTRPTPETDAQITTFDSISKYKKRFKNKTGTVSLDFARRLERERDEALAWVGEIFRLLDLPDGDMGALENCKLELEAARKTLSGIYRWIERRHQDGFLDSLTHEQNLDRVYDALYDRLDTAISERDEAIRQRDETNRSSKYACDYNYEQKLKAERERDEARQAPAWIPVSQALPDDDGTVIVHMDDGEIWSGYLDAQVWRFICGNRIEAKVLHWRPFPDPPRP